MPLANAISAINGMMGTLVAAASASNDQAAIDAANDLNASWQVVTSDPTAVTQAIANDVGAKLIAMQFAAADQDTLDAEAAVHSAISSGLVKYYPELDWYEAAQQNPQASGGKHKPE